MKPYIKLKEITKEFPGVKALDNISLDIYSGKVHILLGENGAGKSTLMKILSGVYRPTFGKIEIAGVDYEYLTPMQSINSGISIVYQELSVINELSILENLYVGHLPTKKVLGVPIVDYKKMEIEAKQCLDKVGINRPLDTLVEELSIGEKQQLEIAKGLLTNAQVIIMDEPTTSLTEAEVSKLFDIVNRLKNEGKAIIYITHKMKEIMQIGDTVSVLKDGTYVGTKDIKDVKHIDELISMMVGRSINRRYNENVDINYTEDNVVLDIRNFSDYSGSVKDISFKLYGGEVLGFSGLVGAGRTELMRLIFGVEKKKTGKLIFRGEELDIKSPYDAIKNGFAMLSENRREIGFFENFDIKKNISLAHFVKNTKMGGLDGFINDELEADMAIRQKEGLNIKCRDINQNIVELSGGNQQKVIIGKWMAADADLIILDEPTKGIDIGSKHDIYSLIRGLANAGKAVLIVSSELPELMAVCDRIAVLFEGRITADYKVKDASEDKLVKAATGNMEE